MSRYAWVTLATSDSYSLGALVLAHSLRRVGTKQDLAILVTPGVTEPMREKLSSVFQLVQEVNVLDSKDAANLALLARPELGITFTKIHCWKLTQYEKCVFVDADTLVVRNCDELFEREELSAAPDVGWPDCFNSGVFVFRPSEETFNSISAFAVSKGSFDGADQGLLNMYFSDWAHKDIAKHLPFIYNMCSTATYSYLPAFKQFGEDVRIIHFIGATKPWLQFFDTMTSIVHPPGGCEHLQPLLQMWWNIFCDNVHPHLTSVMATSNISTIWHDSLTSSTMSEIHLNTYHENSIQDSYGASNHYQHDNAESREIVFYEPPDPWENYDVKSDPFINSPETCITANDGDHEQYYEIATITANQNNESTPMCSDRKIGHFQDDTKIYNIERSNDGPQNPVNTDVQVAPVPVETNFKAINNSPELSNEHDQNHLHHTTQEARPCLKNSNCTNLNYDDSHKKEHKVNFYLESTDESRDESRDQTDDNNEISQEFIVNNTDNDTIESISNPSQSVCTVSNKVAPQIDTTASTCKKATESGLAGALSTLTLGEPRSEQQRVLEDMMRKQNWEQGSIDYLGRDSFDNIMAKINQTLSAFPPKQPSPPRETKDQRKGSRKGSSEREVSAKDDVTPQQQTSEVLPIDSEIALSPSAAAINICPSKPEGSVQSQVSSIILPQICPIKPNIPEIPTVPTDPFVERTLGFDEIAADCLEALSAAKSEPIGQLLKTELNLDIAPAPSDSQKSTQFVSLRQIGITSDPLESILQPGFSPTSTLPPLVPAEVQALQTPIKPPEVSLSMPPLSPDCPVPIQVAESVLQAEPKEVLSSESKALTEEVVSSIIAPLIESPAPGIQTQASTSPSIPITTPNGNDPGLQMNEEKISTGSSVISTDQNTVSIVHQFPPVPSIPLQSPSLGPIALPAPAVSDKSIEPQQTSQTQVLESNLPAPPMECPTRPARGKELTIPGTPIVTGPTPPTSPPLDTEHEQLEKVKENVSQVTASPVEQKPSETSTQQQQPITLQQDQQRTETQIPQEQIVIQESKETKLVEQKSGSIEQVQQKPAEVPPQDKPLVQNVKSQSDPQTTVTPLSPAAESLPAAVVPTPPMLSKESMDSESFDAGDPESAEKKGSPKKSNKKMTKSKSKEGDDSAESPDKSKKDGSGGSGGPVPPRRKSKSAPSKQA